VMVSPGPATFRRRVAGMGEVALGSHRRGEVVETAGMELDGEEETEAEMERRCE
jgi:hypothetical protein